MDATDRVLPATPVVTGIGTGRLLGLGAPLSFWGGLDAATGRIIEEAHPQHGASVVGNVLLLERGKGSSSSSSVLAEAIRNATGPAAIVMGERDLIVALGSIVASELYGLDVPIVVVDGPTMRVLRGCAAHMHMHLHTQVRVRVDASTERATVTVLAP